MFLIFQMISALVSHHPHSSTIPLKLLIPTTTWHIFEHSGGPNLLILKRVA